MKLIIDISEKDYNDLLNGEFNINAGKDAIKNGTLLPKGHGRFVDMKSVEHILGVYACMGGLDFSDLWIQLDDVDTIIEADKENNND